MAKSACGLYLISPPEMHDIPYFVDILHQALAGGRVDAFQLRLKHVPDSHILRAGEAIRAVLATVDCAFIVNDRADLAHALGADGVHLGQGDGDMREARKLLGADVQIGITCHDSRHLAMEAGEAGADYVAFGAFFPTETKTVTHQAGVDLLNWWSGLMEIPCVAIGGITVENAAPLVAAGADFLAVSAGVWAHPQGPGAAVGAFNRLCSA